MKRNGVLLGWVVLSMGFANPARACDQRDRGIAGAVGLTVQTSPLIEDSDFVNLEARSIQEGLIRVDVVAFKATGERVVDRYLFYRGMPFSSRITGRQLQRRIATGARAALLEGFERAIKSTTPRRILLLEFRRTTSGFDLKTLADPDYPDRHEQVLVLTNDGRVADHSVGSQLRNVWKE